MATVKPDPDDMSERILSLCRQSPQGIGDKFLQSEMPDVDPKTRAKAINQVKIYLHLTFCDLY
jgi:hypothetical protein